MKLEWGSMDECCKKAIGRWKKINLTTANKITLVDDLEFHVFRGSSSELRDLYQQSAELKLLDRLREKEFIRHTWTLLPKGLTWQLHTSLTTFRKEVL